MIEEAANGYVIRELPLTPRDLAPLVELHHSVLPSRAYSTPEQQAGFTDELLGALNGRQHLILGAFAEDGTLVGYKLGYRTGNRNECFYSWLGGVHPFHRRRGLAARLTQVQHDWARAQGCQYVETHTWGDNPGMLIVNLQAGFVAAGCLSAVDRAGVRVLMRRVLSE
jgi:predicted GNAT superfamily acetyltransferase